MGLIRDGETENVVKELSEPLVNAAGLSTSSVKFYIVDSAELNAFVMGGQNIFITTGLLAYSESPDIVAGIIAHEIGHIKGGHVISTKSEMANAQKKVIIAALLGAAAGLVAKSPEVAVGSATAVSDASMLQYLKFNRAQESAADLTGLKLLKKAGYSSRGLVTFLNYLEAENRSFNDRSNSYLSTHPLNHERIDFIKHNADESAKGISEVMKSRFKRVNAKIKAFTDDSKEVLNLYKGSSVEEMYAKSIAYYKAGDIKKSVELLDLLIKAEPQNAYFYELKGQVLFENNRVLEAISNYKKAASIKPKDVVIKLAYASALITAKKELKSAIDALDYVVAIEPDNIAAWHQLAIAHNLNGNKVFGTLALGWESILKCDLLTSKKMIGLLESMIQKDNKVLLRKLEDLKSANRALIEYSATKED